MKGGTSLGFRSSEFPQVSSRFRPVPFEALPVSMHPIGLLLLESLSCESSEVSPELDPVDRPGF